jgi:hypothetical protein
MEKEEVQLEIQAEELIITVWVSASGVEAGRRNNK